MPYRQLIDDCFAQRIGVGGLEVDAYAEALVDAGRALEDMRLALAGDGMAPLRLAGARADLADIEAAAARLARFDDLVVLGAGGSSLGGQTLAALADGRRDGPRLRFIDNIDPASLTRLIDGQDPARTGYLAVSKSGTTADTLAQTLVALEAQRRALGDTLAEHFTVVTQPGASPLRALAERWGRSASTLYLVTISAPIPSGSSEQNTLALSVLPLPVFGGRILQRASSVVPKDAI